MIPKFIDICGVPYTVKTVQETFTADACHFGEISYAEGEIRINKEMPEQLQMQTLIHEWVHGALVMLGFNDITANEQFVQAFSVAINQTFELKKDEKHD